MIIDRVMVSNLKPNTVTKLNYEPKHLSYYFLSLGLLLAWYFFSELKVRELTYTLQENIAN